MRTVVLRVVALALLLLLSLVAVLTVRTLNRFPDSLVYFVENGETSFSLEAVGRQTGETGDEAQLRAALEALITGPTAEEAVQGLSTAFPPETRVRGLELLDDHVTVDLSSEFEGGGGTALMMGRLHQLHYTLTQPQGIERITLLIEGVPVEVFGSEGLLTENPWSRARHPTLPVW